jgi:hypothetical protein
MFVLLFFLTCYFLSFDKYVLFVWSTPSTLALHQVSYLQTNLTRIKGPANASFSFCQVFIFATRGCYYNAPSLYSDFNLVKFSSILKEQKSVWQTQAVTFTKAKNQQPGNFERCFMMSIYCSFRNLNIGIHKLADIKVFNDYEVLMDLCCSIFNYGMFGYRRAGTAKMALPNRYLF